MQLNSPGIIMTASEQDIAQSVAIAIHALALLFREFWHVGPEGYCFFRVTFAVDRDYIDRTELNLV